MPLAQRDFSWAQLLRAFQLKSKATPDVAAQIIPVSTVLDLQFSAWPPFVPWTVEADQPASVGNISWCGVFFAVSTGGVATNPNSRVCVDAVDLVTGDSLCRYAIVSQADLTAVVSSVAAQDDSSLDVPSATTSQPLVNDVFGGHNTSAALPIDNKRRVWMQANVPRTLFDYVRPLAILAPNQGFVVSNSNANLLLNCNFRGRYFRG